MREMKDSGVEWIGQIPEKWNVVPLKSYFSFGKGLPITKENLTEQGIPVISYGQIHAKWNSGVTTHPELMRFVSDSYLQTMDKLVGDLSTPHYSRIILEEPELNLFPQSQIDLTYDILKMINVSRDTLFINTHSPYILYALNNCMLGGLVKDKIDDEELLVHKDSFINPQDVSVWELRDGVFSSTQDNNDKTIQDKEGLIRSNYFDRVMHNVMADFRNLMNFHD